MALRMLIHLRCLGQRVWQHARRAAKSRNCMSGAVDEGEGETVWKQALKSD